VGKHEVAGMINPSVAWVPSPAPSGLAVYTGDKIAAWRGSIFSGGWRRRTSAASPSMRRAG
jgi:glucose/arabinose dehydrogenase